MPRFARLSIAIVAGLMLLTRPASEAAGMANDPVFVQGLQWGLTEIGAPEAWSLGTGEGVTIAVVDSGVDLDHEDLKSQIEGHVSCIGANGDPRRCRGSGRDDDGHGTHVAGIALAATDNGTGMAGVAPGARLLAVRALSHECGLAGCTASGNAADVTAGIRWAVANGADVINLSLGGGALQAIGACSFCRAIEEAWDAGVVVVVAAGNDSILPSGFDNEHAIVVTATTRDGGRASYSSASSGLLTSARWPVSAPGGEAETNPHDCGTGGNPKGILSTYWTPDSQGDAYACLAGTSMAAPHVSGALAILMSAGLTPEQAVDTLLRTARDLGPPGRDSSFGVGRIDLARAVQSLPPSSTTSTQSTGSTSTETTRAPSTSTVPSPAPTEAPAPPPPAPPPAVTTPSTAEAAPFSPEAGAISDPGSEPPAGLVALAMAAIAATATATIAAAVRPRG